jgi:proline iminopeptidase
MELYPAVEPYAQGRLDVGDGNVIAWSVSGSEKGKPAVVLHGGPGQGSSPNMCRGFDPERYRVVIFDQRGCGRSTPHASDPATPMHFNTTEHLLRDIEALREHLGIDRWLVAGGSWGSALALAYAQRHPSRVTEIVLTQVTTFRRSEAQWLYYDVSRFFPEAWSRFRQLTPTAKSAQELVAAYVQHLEHPDIDVRLAAARAWCEWEDAVLSLESTPAISRLCNLPNNDMLAFVRICTHYLQHDAWLPENALIQNAVKLGAIPGVLIHGRRDMICPVNTAYELSAAWPGSRLVVLDDAGHLGSESKCAALLCALNEFARTG